MAIVEELEEVGRRKGPRRGAGRAQGGARRGQVGLSLRSEGCLRKALRRALGDRLFWIEAGRGGTVGMPDTLVAGDKRSTLLELKLGEIVGGGLRFKVRREQRHCLRRLKRQGIPCGIVVGIKGTQDVVFLECNERTYKGHLPNFSSAKLMDRFLDDAAMQHSKVPWTCTSQLVEIIDRI